MIFTRIRPHVLHWGSSLKMKSVSGGSFFRGKSVKEELIQHAHTISPPHISCYRTHIMLPHYFCHHAHTMAPHTHDVTSQTYVTTPTLCHTTLLCYLTTYGTTPTLCHPTHTMLPHTYHVTTHTSCCSTTFATTPILCHSTPIILPHNLWHHAHTMSSHTHHVTSHIIWHLRCRSHHATSHHIIIICCFVCSEPCYSSPCKNGGTCDKTTSSPGVYGFTCTCAAGYTGNKCQTSK